MSLNITAPHGKIAGWGAMMLEAPKNKYKNLLPSHTESELGLRLEHLNQPIANFDSSILRDLNDPKKIPAHLLPWLAINLSVDVWQENWTEAQKRQACANAIFIHKQKGTKGGLKQALRALNIDGKISQWYEYGGKEYHFKVDVEINEQGLTDVEQDTILLTIYEAKNLRSWLEKLVFWLSSKANLFVGAALTWGEHINILPFIQTNIAQSNFNPFLGMVMQDCETLTIYPRNKV